MHAVLQQGAVSFISRAGSVVTLRPCVREDMPAIAEMYRQLSAETIRLRYCSAGIRVSGENEAMRICGPDPSSHMVWLALSNGEVIGLGELVREPADPCRAEVALLVRDDRQREGIGTELCHQLVDGARRSGIARLQVYLLAENKAMLRLIRKLPVSRTTEYYGGEMQIELDLRVPVEAG